MTGIGNMLWRIGDILDFDEQLAWTRKAGFDGVGFHAAPGTPGQWRGLEPTECDSARRAAVREALSSFTFTEIHAPFRIHLTGDSLAAGLEELAPILQFAADLDVSVVTVHADLTDDEGPAWLGPMTALAALAEEAQTIIVLEIVEGFEAVRGWDLDRIRVNLDVGHMCDEGRVHSLAPYGGIGGLIRHLGPTLAHLHLHDTDGVTDHCEIGTGIVDFEAIAAALSAIDYPRDATMEMNPTRCSPDGMRRGMARLRALFAEAGGR